MKDNHSKDIHYKDEHINLLGILYFFGIDFFLHILKEDNWYFVCGNLLPEVGCDDFLSYVCSSSVLGAGQQCQMALNTSASKSQPSGQLVNRHNVLRKIKFSRL